MPATALLWFRRDLRLADNPALARALEVCERVVPVYIHAPEEEAPWQPGAASRWWLHHSLAALDSALRGLGSGLVYWEPAFLAVPGGPPDPCENQTLFDFGGAALPALGFPFP